MITNAYSGASTAKHERKSHSWDQVNRVTNLCVAFVWFWEYLSKLEKTSHKTTNTDKITSSMSRRNPSQNQTQRQTTTSQKFRNQI